MLRLGVSQAFTWKGWQTDAEIVPLFTGRLEAEDRSGGRAQLSWTMTYRPSPSCRPRVDPGRQDGESHKQ